MSNKRVFAFSCSHQSPNVTRLVLKKLLCFCFFLFSPTVLISGLVDSYVVTRTFGDVIFVSVQQEILHLPNVRAFSYFDFFYKVILVPIHDAFPKVVAPTTYNFCVNITALSCWFQKVSPLLNNSSFTIITLTFCMFIFSFTGGIENSE